VAHLTVIAAWIGIGLALGVAILSATVLAQPLPQRPAVRWASLSLLGLAVGASAIAGVSRGFLIVGSVAVLIAARAELAQSLSQRRPSVTDDEGNDEPAWWPDFEQAFQRYVARSRCGPPRSEGGL